MKIYFAKIILIFVVVITSVNVCFSVEENCNKIIEKTITDSHKSIPDKKTNNADGRHCLCSLVCHNLFITFPTSSTSPDVFVITETTHSFKSLFYPQVIISFDKPPTI